jgi:thioredoxin-like negative regulator of GroEL
MPSKAQQRDTGPQPNREELLQMGIRAAKSGNKEGARMMLEQVLSQDKRNERAMMWMAKIADNKPERKKWLDKVLEVNPDNTNARTALKNMVYQQSARENRTLLMFGVVVGVLIVLAIVVVIALSFR